MLSTLTTNEDGSFKAIYYRPEEPRMGIDSFLDWLHAGREEVIRFRTLARKEFGLKAVALLPQFAIENNARKILRRVYIGEEPLPVRVFTRAEKIGTLGALALMSSCAALSGNASPIAAMAVTPVMADTNLVVVPKPLNWLDGTVIVKGNKEAVIGAYNYAATAGYPFAKNEAAVQELASIGSLVKLEGPYLKLQDVSQPYALPAIARFTNRLAKQYAQRGCGKLVVTSAMRTHEAQSQLSNGSDLSVHPAGMSVDLRRMTSEEKGGSFCLSWLEKTLKTVEKERRIDVTFEESPRHFHVVVLPNEYNNWLSQVKPGLDPEVEALATALYFEGAFNETEAGYEAIAAVIKNRARSKEYPSSILEVVAQGAAGRSTGGCQFSFMCDGRAENIQTLCSPDSKDRQEFWEAKCTDRWQQVVRIAKSSLGNDKRAV